MLEQSDSAIKLTFRQKAFLNKLLDVYREMQEPIHYSVVAERLGLSNSTAYDMLRVLEQKGMVSSQYATPKETSGPGRSSILFSPTTESMNLFYRLAGESYGKEGWEDVKIRIMTNLQQGKAANYQKLLQELLSKVPEAQSPLAQCAEIVTVLLLSLREARHELTEQSLIGVILKEPVSKLRMSILAGIALGLSSTDHRVQQRLGYYREHTEKYEASLQKLNKEGLVALYRFIRDVWNILKAAPLQ